jgi:hypothetical protein
MNTETLAADDARADAQDLRQIALSKCYEVRDWCHRLRCTKEELHDAVKAVGPAVQSVREYLRR